MLLVFFKIIGFIKPTGLAYNDPKLNISFITFSEPINQHGTFHNNLTNQQI